MEVIDKEELLSKLKSMFIECRDNTQSSRDEATIDAGYFHGSQWTAAEKAELRRRRQPVITYNLIKPKISTICGVEENSQTDPKAIPRTPADDDAAQVVTQVLRYISDISRFDKKRIEIFRDTIIYGIGGAIVEVMPSKDTSPEVVIRRVRYETIVYDPHSREEDFSDARYIGIAQWMDEKDAIAAFGKEHKEILASSIDDQSLNDQYDTYSDRPSNYVWGCWGDKKRRRLLIIDLYHREGDGWHRSVFTGAGILVSGPSEYKDDDGQPHCPIILTSCYIDHENNRYGIVRDMRSPQDEINHRRSKLLHLINTRQTFRKEGALSSQDPQGLKRELNKPDGDIVLNPSAAWGQDIGIIDTGAQTQGQAELLAEAKGFIDQIGPNNALSGIGTESQSGRAILAQQQAGVAMLATIYAGHSDFMLRVFRSCWSCVKQFWTAPKYIRVTDDLQSLQFIQVNEPILDDMGQPQIDPQTGQPAMTNRLAEMGVDLDVERAPASANLQEEQFQKIAELLQNPEFRKPEIFAELVKNSALKNKKELIDAITAPPSEEEIQLQQRGAMAEIAEKEAATEDKRASALYKQAQARQLMAESEIMMLQSQIMQPVMPQQEAQPMPLDMGEPPPPQELQPPPVEEGLELQPQPLEAPLDTGFFNDPSVAASGALT